MSEHPLLPRSPSPLPVCTSVLVFAPHPDDETFGCGGTLALHAAAGVKIHIVVLTDGAGRTPAGLTKERETQRREAESRQAAQVLGLTENRCEIHFWHLPDGALEYSEAMITRLMEAIRACGADLIYAPSLFEEHPDHRACSMAALEAVRRMGGGLRLAMYEVGAPGRPNTLVDITPVMDIKREAMRCFVSQLAHQRYDEHIEALNRYRAYTLPPDVRAAEAFEVVDAASLSSDGLALFASEYAYLRRRGIAFASPKDCPLVSIVTRSMARTSIAEALGSVALQTYPNIEVVVVNAKGGDHPDPSTMMDRFPVRLINRDGPPLSRAASANAGLQACTGKWVLFLDEDDLLLADHVDRLVRTLRESKTRAAYAGVRVESANGEVLRVYDEPWSVTRLYGANYLPIHAVLFERSLLDEGCRFDESLECLEDWDFWLQLSTHTEFARAPGVSAVYRIGLGQSAISARFSEEIHLDNRARLYAKWKALIPDKDWGRAFYWYALEREQWLMRSRECEGSLQEHASRLRECEGSLQEHASRLRECEGSLQEHASRLQEYAAQLQLCQTQLQGANEQVEALSATLSAMRNTLSWKITAPLRAIRRAMYRVARRGQSDRA